MKIIPLVLSIVLLPLWGTAQSFSIFAPDSARNIARPGSSGSFTITNPLNHNGIQFGNAPITVSCIMNCTADDLYFYDFDMNIPTTFGITGIELIHSRGACNSGSYMTDTIFLAYNGVPIGNFKRDTASITETDTLGGSNDLWGAPLTHAMLNDPSFGVIIRSTGSGICTYGQWNVQLLVYYDCIADQDTGRIPDSVSIVSRPGSTGSYTISNPLTNNLAQFNNPPTTVSCAVNCIADHLYFQDWDFNIPANAQISGVELRKSSGACNSGSVMIDTVQLAYNGAVIGQIKWDSSGVFYNSVFGSHADLWGAVLTPAMINDPSFGVFVTSTSIGVCTYMQSILRMTVTYCIPSSPSAISGRIPDQYFSFYPNPARHSITLLWHQKESLPFEILDINGRRMLSGILRGEKTEVNLNSLLPGVYFIKVAEDKALPQRLVVH